MTESHAATEALPSVHEAVAAELPSPNPSLGGESVDVVECGRLKGMGNNLFNQGRFSEALVEYRKALLRALIKPKPEPSTVGAGTPVVSGDGAGQGDATGFVSPDTKQAEGQEGGEDPAYTLTSQVYFNAGSCLRRLGKKEEACEMFSEAVRHNAGYTKAYLYRAETHFDLQKWSSAFSDYESHEKLGGVLDTGARTRKMAAKAKMDEEMKKMLGDLKNLGNRFLGNFGLSIDNFKFDKDPNTGGYSMRFEQ